jgi:hypothetical protein
MFSAGSRAETTSIDKPGETTMFNKTGIVLSVMIVFSAGSGAFAASNRDSGPDCTPNGPFFYVDTYGVPPAVLHQVQKARRPHNHLASRPN